LKDVYEFEPEMVERFIKQHKAKRAAVQLPAGIRPYLSEIESPLSKCGAEVVVLADSCYGACDIADARAKQLGCDVLLHYGHADMGIRTCLPTLYVEARMTANPTEAVEKALQGQKFKRLGIVTTVQHIGFISQVEKIVRSLGITPLVGKPGPRAKYSGQVLGCDWGCARAIVDDADAFLYVGTGRFHPVGVGLATGKEVITANPLAKGSEKIIGGDDFLKKRKAMISRAAPCRSFGVLVSTKPGQARFKLASNLVNEFRKSGLSAHLLVTDEITPEKIGDFKEIEAFVCVACPRLPIEDAARFDRPILTPFEAMVMLGKTNFEPYQLDEVRGSDF
jgi:2-(3-amino-3-carboxypropyl)histidine synthase